MNAKELLEKYSPCGEDVPSNIAFQALQMVKRERPYTDDVVNMKRIQEYVSIAGMIIGQAGEEADNTGVRHGISDLLLDAEEYLSNLYGKLTDIIFNEIRV